MPATMPLADRVCGRRFVVAVLVVVVVNLIVECVRDVNVMVGPFRSSFGKGGGGVVWRVVGVF